MAISVMITNIKYINQKTPPTWRCFFVSLFYSNFRLRFIAFFFRTLVNSFWGLNTSTVFLTSRE